MLHAAAAAALALADPSGPVVEARIADVIADPERYGGQTLRLRGQLDACYGWVCSICPEEMTHEMADSEKCLSLSFDGFGAPQDEGLPENRSFSTALWREMEESFRFSVVTAEGTFDPSCLTGRERPRAQAPEGQGPQEVQEVIVCTDRAPRWQDVRFAPFTGECLPTTAWCSTRGAKVP